jgi:hypothetical protein
VEEHSEDGLVNLQEKGVKLTLEMGSPYGFFGSGIDERFDR